MKKNVCDLIPLKNEGRDLIQLKDRDSIPLREKSGIQSMICTAILLSETLFSLPLRSIAGTPVQHVPHLSEEGLI